MAEISKIKVRDKEYNINLSSDTILNLNTSNINNLTVSNLTLNNNWDNIIDNNSTLLTFTTKYQYPYSLTFSSISSTLKVQQAFCSSLMGTTNKFPKSVTYLLPQAPEFEANVIGENPNKEVKISSEDYVDNKVNEEVNNVETELTNKINNLSLSTNTTNIAAYQPGAKNINITSINITQQDESQTNLMLFQTTLSYPNQTFSFSTGHIYIKYVESSSSHMIPIILFCYESGSRGTYMQSKVICLTSQLYTGDLMSKGSWIDLCTLSSLGTNFITDVSLVK